MDLNFKLTMIEIIAYIFGVVLVMVWCYFKWQNRHFEKLSAIMPGPPAYPIIGTGYQFFGSSERNENNKFIKKINVLLIFIF